MNPYVRRLWRGFGAAVFAAVVAATSGATAEFALAGTSARTSASSDAASALALQSDGKFVAAGRDSFDFALARYRPNGSLDRGFGAGGRVVTSIAGADFAAVAAVATQGDEKLMALGSASYKGNDTWPVLARYRRDGRLDRTFGKAGEVRTDFGPAERSSSTTRSASRRRSGASRAGASPHGGTLLAASPHRAFTVRGDGSAYHRLRQGRTMLGVALAPSGRWIAFAQAPPNGSRNVLVKIARPDGTHERTVATLPSRGLSVSNVGPRGGLDWSLDSRRIAFATQRGLWIARANGKRARLIVARPGAASAVWSPRGDRIAFERAFDRHGQLTAERDIYTASPDGSSFRRVATAQGYGLEPVSWSPDGQRIVYSTRRDPNLANSTLHSLDVGTGAERILGDGASPTWSPRGDLIAFSINKNHGAGGPMLAIAVERPDGADRRVLADGYSQPVWSPVGEQIAFSKYVERGLWRVPATGGAPRKIAPSGQVNHIDWSR